MALTPTNVVAMLHAEDVLKMEEFENPPLQDDQVLVRMKRVGICGSDVHYLKHMKIGDFVVKAPMILGHESSGVIEEVGAAVTDLQVGDRVALEPGVPCGKCEHCLAGKYNLCPDIQFFATPPVHGSLRRFVPHKAKFTFKLPDEVSLEEGAMCEPLSVGVYACEQKVNVQPGDSLAVFGAGPIGTITTMVAMGLGATRIFMCDIDPKRLKFVEDEIDKGRGIITCLQTRGLDSETLANSLIEQNGGKKLDGCIDCCGVESAIQAAILATKNGGKVCLVGMGRPQISLPLLNASTREVDLLGVFRYRFTYPKCIKLLASKKIDVAPLLTHSFPYTQEGVLDAFVHCETGKDGCIKCMINVEE